MTDQLLIPANLGPIRPSYDAAGRTGWRRTNGFCLLGDMTPMLLNCTYWVSMELFLDRKNYIRVTGQFALHRLEDKGDVPTQIFA